MITIITIFKVLSSGIKSEERKRLTNARSRGIIRL